MREPERVLAREARSGPRGQLLAHERDQVWPRSLPVRVGQERLDGADVEAAALDRGVFQQGALAGLEAIDARSEHRLDARWQRGLAGIGSDGDELLEEERVALSRADDP